MKQPDVVLVPQSTLPDTLPSLSAAPVPPGLPSNDYAPPPKEYLEQPGGEVLVLGLLVDDTGAVRDSKILVPSHNALGDVSFAMLALNERISTMDPPLKPGEQRWLEVRIVFPFDKKPETLP